MRYKALLFLFSVFLNIYAHTIGQILVSSDINCLDVNQVLARLREIPDNEVPRLEYFGVSRPTPPSSGIMRVSSQPVDTRALRQRVLRGDSDVILRHNELAAMIREQGDSLVGTQLNVMLNIPTSAGEDFPSIMDLRILDVSTVNGEPQLILQNLNLNAYSVVSGTERLSLSENGIFRMSLSDLLASSTPGSSRLVLSSTRLDNFSMSVSDVSPVSTRPLSPVSDNLPVTVPIERGTVPVDATIQPGAQNIELGSFGEVQFPFRGEQYTLNFPEINYAPRGSDPVETMMVNFNLSREQAESLQFAEGGMRTVFQHPTNPDQVVKIFDQTRIEPEQIRRAIGRDLAIEDFLRQTDQSHLGYERFEELGDGGARFHQLLNQGIMIQPRYSSEARTLTELIREGGNPAQMRAVYQAVDYMNETRAILPEVELAIHGTGTGGHIPLPDGQLVPTFHGVDQGGGTFDNVIIEPVGDGSYRARFIDW